MRDHPIVRRINKLVISIFIKLIFSSNFFSKKIFFFNFFDFFEKKLQTLKIIKNLDVYALLTALMKISSTSTLHAFANISK